jgi:CBS domain-containing protein
MNVGLLCRRNVVTVRKADGLTAAAKLMREHHIGYLVVIEPDFAGATARPIGVLTDRDIVVAVVAREADPRKLTVSDVMTPNPVVLELGDTLAAAMAEMRRAGVRRMPVIGTAGELVGLLSLDDVLEVLAGELQNIAGAMRNERRIEGDMRP